MSETSESPTRRMRRMTIDEAIELAIEEAVQRAVEEVSVERTDEERE